ncbi:MAG TPA: hypothetical protein VE961_26995 [Pyrinomonadaceae bacterium]|nr:hypothetical protein [Pyrinomonadaceae bacterium]
MSGNICREVRREIDQSELRQSLSNGSEAHLESCAACAAFRDERARLRELVGGLKPVSAPADFEMRLRARIARERDLPAQPFIFRFMTSTPAIVVAAILVVAVAAFVFISQQNRRQSPALATGNGNPATTPAPVTPQVAQEIIHEPAPTGAPDGGAVKIKQLPPQLPLAPRTALKTNAPATNRVEVNDFAMRGATPVFMADRHGEVSLTAPVRPMVVTMYDEHGGTRKIQLPPISFGSQRLPDSRTQVSMTNMKDW